MLSSLCAGSSSSRFSAADSGNFFFQPLKLHLEAAYLFVNPFAKSGNGIESWFGVNGAEGGHGVKHLSN